MITTVLLDFYNTLYAAHEWFELEVRGLPAQALQVLAARGRAVTREQEERAGEAWVLLRRGVEARGREVSAVEGLRRVLLGVGVTPPDDLPEIVRGLQRAAYRPGREEPGMVECVRALAAEGYTLGIVSNALSEEFLSWSLEGTGIRECFAGVYTSAGVGYYKSSPRLYEAALSSLGAGPGEAVHVGDSYRYDVLGGRAAGLRTVWYAPGGERPPGDEVDAVIRTLGELPAVVRELSAGGVVGM